MLYWWFSGQDVFAAPFFFYYKVPFSSDGSVWTAGFIAEIKKKISPV